MLNEKQEQAIKQTDGKVRIIAGAGSGKTTVLTQRYVEILKKGVDPNNILCITFTNKAAQEMRDRIKKALNDSLDTDKLLIKTFHSFCLSVLRASIHYLGYPNNFTILDDADQSDILKQLYKDHHIDYNYISYATAKAKIATRKINTEDCLLDMMDINSTNIKKAYENAARKFHKSQYDDIKAMKDVIYYGYLYNEQKNKSLDFNDLILYTVILFKKFPDILKMWQNKLQYIMVDEFQDASYRQYELVSMLSKVHGNLFVVGDPDQTIYSWRGAKPEILVNFDETENADTIILNQNYRSTPEILNVANEIIAKNTLRVEKDLFTDKVYKDGKIIHRHFMSNVDEAAWIVNKIREYLNTGNYQPKDFAVLYRMHFLSRSVEEQLIRANIPYRVFSGINFYERAEIKDILAYLKLIANPNDDVSLRRAINVPSRKIGTKKLDKIKEEAENNNTSLWVACNKLHDSGFCPQLESFIFAINKLRSLFALNSSEGLKALVEKTLEITGYSAFISDSLEEDRVANIKEFLTSLEEFKDLSLSEYLQEITLLTNTDKKTGDAVSLMTVHSSKGLEFPVVFVVGLSEGIFPSYKAELLEEREEERRLAYVAYTRAKEELILTESEGSTFNNINKIPSRFITEIDSKYLDTNLGTLSSFNDVFEKEIADMEREYSPAGIKE